MTMQPDSRSPRRYRLHGRFLQVQRTFLLSPGEHQVGSAEANDLVLPVPGVSRCHARLAHHAEPGGEARFWLRDLESRNGTFVNGERVTERAEIRSADVLRFGPVELRLENIEAGDAELAMVLPAPPERRSAAAQPQAEPHPRDAALPIDETTAGFHRTPVSAPPAPGLILPPGCVTGRSPAMARLYGAMQALLGADLPVLIEGETGVGKESVARTLHLSSSRRERPFVAINCAAIPAEMLEAEMFGIGDRVATGVKQRPGKFRAAEGGTLLLDELAEMPLELQAKLLRALQEKEVQPVGGKAVPVDVWVLAATNLDLLERVRGGSFRRDLYYRVAGSVLEVPALRDRREDVPCLVEHFLKHSAAGSGKSILGVTVRCLEALVGYPWPGNVRELQHEVRRLAHRCGEGQAIESSLLSKNVLAGVAGPALPPRADRLGPSREVVEPETAELDLDDETLRLEDHVQATERKVILQALRRSGGSQRKAARLLGIARSTLLRKIDKLAIPT